MNAFMKSFSEPVSECEGGERVVGEKNTWAVVCISYPGDSGITIGTQSVTVGLSLSYEAFTVLWTPYSVLSSNYFVSIL